MYFTCSFYMFKNIIFFINKLYSNYKRKIFTNKFIKILFIFVMLLKIHI